MESPEHAVLNSTGSSERAIKVCFYVIFVFISRWHALLTSCTCGGR